MRVAFIGLGNMGRGMARNLARAGHELTIWNRTAEKAKEVPGAKAASTPAEAAREAEVIFTMVSDDHALESVVFGKDGFLKTLPKNAVHVSSSTISVALSRRLLEAHREHGHRFISVPVFGRPEVAEQGKLWVVAAGDSRTIEACNPLLSVIGQRTFVMGDDPVNANVVKLSGNFLIISILEALGESVALSRKYGIEASTLVDFFTNSLFSAPIFKTYGGIIASEKYEPAGFKLQLGLKDVRLALAAGDSANVPLPIASLIHDHALGGVANGLAEKDWSVLAKLAADRAGLK